MRLALLLICIFSTPAFATPHAELQQGRIAIIAGKNIDRLSNQEIHRIFTLRQKLLPNNEQVKLITLPLSNPITQQFTQKVFDLYPYQLKRHWDRQVYSGRAPAPVMVADEKDIIRYIINTPNALSYISTDSEFLIEYKGAVHVIATY